jgi:hypothetical protein
MKTDAIAKLLHGRCESWPECSCGQKWDHWATTLQGHVATGVPLSAEAYNWALTDLPCMLSCVAEHCPDKRIRRHALVQLMHPIFAEECRR